LLVFRDKLGILPTERFFFIRGKQPLSSPRFLNGTLLNAFLLKPAAINRQFGEETPHL